MAPPVMITAELLLNGTFTDISQFVYQRDPITITGGRADESSKPQHAQLTLTLDNRDGRFTPNYTGGAYYPYLLRGTEIRVSAQFTTTSGNFYSGYRFWGEVPSWPPLSDPSGTDIYVQVTASGPLRRARQGGGKGSALTRYYATLTGNQAPIAYWPCEEDPFTTLIGAGIDGGTNMTVTSGTPTWKAVSKFNGSAPIAVVNGSTWDGATGSFGTSGDDVFSSPGTFMWVASTTSVDARCWGGGGGGSTSSGLTGSGGGGGGEFAREATLAVTPGSTYTVTVGKGGKGGSNAESGHATTFAGDAVTVTAHGGTWSDSRTGGAGGTGSANATHHDGGAGGTSSTGSGTGGGGGGGSGGTAAAGNAGGSTSSSTGGTGAAAVTGGGKGGAGGDAAGGTAAFGGGTPGGGGGGSFTNVFGTAKGAPGGSGQIELIYTSSGGGTLPNANIVRFILYVPPHGGNKGAVILNANTGGTVSSLRVYYQKGGNLQLKGFASANGGGATKFDSGNVAFSADGTTLMVSCELKTSGANVAWKFTAIQPGASAVVATASGTVTTATIGNVSEVLVAPNADITKTAIGHISVQYALVDIRKVSAALDGHHTEMGVDRFIRLANEQAMDNATEFTERTDHWGFRDGTQGWAATNGAVSSSTVFTSSQDTDASGVWSFTVSGTPAFNNYFILTTAQAASVSIGDRITISAAPALTYMVTNVGAPAFGFNNITFAPDAAAVVASPQTVSSGAHSLLLTANGSGQPFAFTPAGTSGVPVNAGDIVSAACEVFAPTALPKTYISVKFFDSGGTALTETASADLALDVSTETTLKVTATADATAAFFNIHVGDHNTDANNTLMYIDNVRVHPRMGPQTRKEYHKFLEEIEDLDQGIMKEARDLHGLRYRTRFRLINQTPALTLDYSAAHLAVDVPAPVVDDQNFHDHIILHRHRGSKVSKGTGISGPPPGQAPTKRRKVMRVAAEKDEQLFNLALHLLSLGTVTGERYPLIATDLLRSEVKNIASAIAGVEIGDYVQITNLPFWYPSTTAKQLVIGYTEVLTPFDWTIEWNCAPESPLEIVSIPRW